METIGGTTAEANAPSENEEPTSQADDLAAENRALQRKVSDLEAVLELQRQKERQRRCVALRCAVVTMDLPFSQQ